MTILEKIHGHQDLLQLSPQDRVLLCSEIREFLIASVSRTGGHLASNLGVVELTVAIETVFNTQKDRLVFDVGHQSYVHKMLTDRQADFDSLRQFGGMAGFPKPSESDTDAFVAGHASSSVSIGLGMARARTLMGHDYHVITLLGDGAATGGMAYEGLNDAAVSGEPMIIILNDNAMSIDRNVGGMAYHLRNLRAKPKYLGMKDHYRKFLGKLPGGQGVYRITRSIKDWLRRMLIPATIFESMGFTYLGPADGHDTEQLIELLENAKAMQQPVVLHVLTHKGHGYKPAEENPRKFHGVGPFDAKSGKIAENSTRSFSQAFGDEMIRLAEQTENLCAITAAMPGGTGLLEFMKRFPNRLFDVGIAEEHAVSMAGGLSKQGMIPVIALYSTFLQRSYDMILQDICMLNLHAIFAIDRAGLVGEDGETHHGVFDVGFLRQAPNLKILCPASCAELSDMLRWAVNGQKGPVAIRYPRGGDRGEFCSAWPQTVDATGELCCHQNGDDVTIVTYGTMVQNALEAAQILHDNGVEATVLRLLSLSPLPIEKIIANLSATPSVFVLEEACCSGIRPEIASKMHLQISKCKVFGADLGNQFVPHGSITQIYRQYGLDAQSVAKSIMEVISNEN